MSSNSTETKGGSAVGQLKSLARVSVMRRLRGYTWVSDRHSGIHRIFLPFVICCSVRIIQTLPSTTCLLSQDYFPMVQQHGSSGESLRLTTMLFATCSSFSHIFLLCAPMAHQLPCSSLQNLSLQQVCVMFSHTVAKALPIPCYEMLPMLRSQAIDSTNPFIFFSDSLIC